MILNDQLVVDPTRSHDRPDILAETIVSGTVGYGGTERHLMRATIWAAKPSRPHPMAGQLIGGRRMPETIPASPVHVGSLRADCGSQRAGSSVRNVSITLPITCERCLAPGRTARVQSLPTDVLTEQRGTIVPREA